MAKFEVALLNLMGNSNIGVYLHASEKYVLVPPGIESDDLETIKSVLKVEPITALVGGSRLLGVLATGNSKGILLGSTAKDEEVKALKETLGDSVQIEVLPSKNNAVGNLIACNDKAALVYPGLEKDTLQTIRDVLDVEIEEKMIAGVGTVGSIIVVTNKGGLVHPDATDDELEFLTSFFGVPFLTGTVNFGVSFVRTGLVANTKGALVGGETRGPEVARIQMALGGGISE